MISDFVKKIKKADVVSHTNKVLDQINKINKSYHYFITIDDTHTLNQLKSLPKGKLYGLPVSVKDCICVEGMETKAGSRILESYKPVFDATVIKKLKSEGAVIIGKTTQDAFGFGTFNTNVGLGGLVPKNPHDKNRVTGGSSGGAAGFTQIFGKPHIAVAESTGGSIAAPASYCGVFGMTPTYGRVSRYGLIDYSNSMDKIGLMAKDIEDIALVLEIISGYDEKDATSANIPVETYTKNAKKEYRIAIVQDFFGPGVQKGVIDNIYTKLKSKFDKVSLPLTFKYGVATYYLLSMSESSTNLAKYCGMRYGLQSDPKGNFNEYFSDIRSQGFSKEEKRRIILGSFARMSGFRDAFYLKALKVRTLIIEEYKKLLKKYDILITPTMPNIAPKFSEISKLKPLEHYMMDIMTVGPNLAGLPHLNIPTGFSNKMPTGMLIIADHFNEKHLINYARRLR